MTMSAVSHDSLVMPTHEWCCVFKCVAVFGTVCRSMVQCVALCD